MLIAAILSEQGAELLLFVVDNFHWRGHVGSSSGYWQMPSVANFGKFYGRLSCQNWQILSVAKIGKYRQLPNLLSPKLPKLEFEHT